MLVLNEKLVWDELNTGKNYIQFNSYELGESQKALGYNPHKCQVSLKCHFPVHRYF